MSDERDYIDRTIATVRNHRDADNCWPQWANIFADEIERQRAECERLRGLLDAAQRESEDLRALLDVAQFERERLRAALTEAERNVDYLRSGYEVVLADCERLRAALKGVGNAYGCYAGCTGALPGAPADGSGHTPACRAARAALGEADGPPLISSLDREGNPQARAALGEGDDE